MFVLAVTGLLLRLSPDAGSAATCAFPWRSESSALEALEATDDEAVLCASGIITSYVPGSPDRPFDRNDLCVRVGFDGGVFTKTAELETPAAAFELKATESGAAACIRGACTPLSESEMPPPEEPQRQAFNATGSRVAIALQRSRGVDLFDTATGKKVKTLGIKADAVYFIGDALLTSDSEQSGQWLFTGSHQRKVDWNLDTDCSGAVPRVQVKGTVWAIAELRPNRIRVIDVTTGAQVRVIGMPSLDWVIERGAGSVSLPKGRFAGIGITPCTTMPGARLVRTPNGHLVYVTSSGVALIDPSKGTVRVFPFPRCPKA